MQLDAYTFHCTQFNKHCIYRSKPQKENIGKFYYIKKFYYLSNLNVDNDKLLNLLKIKIKLNFFMEVPLK